MTADLDRAAVCAEMEQVRRDFHDLLGRADGAALHRRSDGTRWSNRQLLFHMLFGYLVVRALLVLVRAFGRLPRAASRGFARLLDSARVPFHLVNYLGSVLGAWLVPAAWMPGMLDRVIRGLQRRLRRETGSALGRGMHYPQSWDPLFAGYMTLADIYRYPAQHFRYHQRQLTLDRHGDGPGTPGPSRSGPGERSPGARP